MTFDQKRRSVTRGKRTRFVVGGLLIALMSPAATTQAFADQSIGAPIAPITTSEANMNPASSIAEASQSFARSAYDSVFGGMALANNGSQVDIFLTTLNQNIEQAIVQASGGASSIFHFIATPTTEAQQNALHDALTSDATSLIAQGIHLAVWGTDIFTGHEEAQVVGLTSSQQSYLTQMFGPNLSVVNLPAAEAPVPLDRENDSAPWNGGDFISDGGGDCSSGIPVHNSGGAYYLITAAHCFALNANIDNYSVTIPYGSNTYMGYVAAQNVATNGVDAELVVEPGQSSDLLYTGGSVNAARSIISGAATSPVGYQVCVDGAFEGEMSCSLTIQSNNNCQNIDAAGYGVRIACHLVLATGNNPQTVGQGDSGGPVFRFEGSSLYGTGTVSTSYGAATTCSNWYPQTTRNCYSGFYYTDLGPTLSTWGLIVN